MQSIMYIQLSFSMLLQIFHATCHAEMATSSSLAARLRNEITSSRSGTSEADIKRCTRSATSKGLEKIGVTGSPASDQAQAGVKRKAEEDASDIVNVTPPFKKVAVSVP